MRVLSWLPPSFATYVYTVLFKPPALRRALQALVRRFIPDTLSIHGLELALNQRDAIVSGSLALGCYETSLLHRFRTLLHEGMHFVDIGANIGLYSIIGAQSVGITGKVLAIEPSDENCNFLRRSIALNRFSQITIFQGAAGNESKETRLFLNEMNFADHRVYDESGKRPSTLVRMRTVDELVEEELGGKVDAIKLDVQGAEALVFEGMLQTLRKNSELFILMEFWPWGILHAGGNPQQLLKLIRSSGFEIFEFSELDAEFHPVSKDESLLVRNLERQHANLLIKRGYSGRSATSTT